MPQFAREIVTRVHYTKCHKSITTHPIQPAVVVGFAIEPALSLGSSLASRLHEEGKKNRGRRMEWGKSGRDMQRHGLSFNDCITSRRYRDGIKLSCPDQGIFLTSLSLRELRFIFLIIIFCSCDHYQRVE